MANPSFLLREFFHLTFLRQLASRLAGRPCVLKGGVCLRFFHQSQRLSEDADFDVGSKLPPDTLRRHVDSILASRAFRATLLGAGVADLVISRPKQTETVQRWKVGLVMAKGQVLPTKLEFSRRQEKISPSSGIPDPDLLRLHRVPPFSANYYGAEALAAQKVTALASPSRSAVRDLFDLHHLMTYRKADPRKLGTLVPREVIERAVHKIQSFSRGDFLEQVVPFLTPELIAHWSRPESFAEITKTIEEFLSRVSA